ncbi:MAG: ATP-dependent RNA helicase RhlE [Saprospiraceae bacterium]|jgi:ATP-dependent RNA helicase RhlE
MNDFSEFGLNRQLLNAIDDLGYVEPTDIQKKAIPKILNGQHVIGVAPTGTGKTASYVLPILKKLNYAKGDDPRCVIFLPTHELVYQVHQNLVDLGKYTDLRFTKVFGGGAIKGQREALMEGTDIIIATPGRFMDLYSTGYIHLKSVNTMVLDEADKMMDMGFMPQLNKILEIVPKKKQNLLFSATFHKNIEKLSEDFLEFPVKIEVKHEFKTVDTVDQFLYKTPNYRTKCNLLIKLLEDENLSRVLVFTRTKETAANLHKFLERKEVGAWSVIHANKGQNTRINAFTKFQNGELRGIVATDVVARGIDISEVSHVVNFEIPVMYSEYIHRIGRTGRAKKEGTSITFASPVEEFHIPKIETMIGKEIPLLKIPEDVEITETSKEEAKNYAREMDRLKKKDDPAYQGAFHERKKGMRNNQVSKKNLRAYKFSGKRRNKKK